MTNPWRDMTFAPRTGCIEVSGRADTTKARESIFTVRWHGDYACWNTETGQVISPSKWRNVSTEATCGDLLDACEELGSWISASMSDDREKCDEYVAAADRFLSALHLYQAKKS